MRKITIPNQGLHDYVYAMDSGRTLKISASAITDPKFYSTPQARVMALPEDGPPNRGDFYLVLSAAAVDAATGEVVVEDGETVTDGPHAWHMEASTFSSGSESLESYWKLFRNLASPAVNPEPPEGLAAGDAVADALGQRWLAGNGHPSKVLGDGYELGDFYVDLTNGNKYRHRIGRIEHQAKVYAQEFDDSLHMPTKVAATGLPEFTPPAAVEEPVEEGGE